METIIKTELSVKEFDPTLTSILNFTDPEAFKALVCPLGLEEFRAVVRYELLNLHLLIVGVRHNQILLDNSERQLSEVQLFEKGYLVSAPTCDILNKLQGENLYEANLKKLPIDEKRKINKRIVNNSGKIFFSIMAKKIRSKETVENQYKKIRQAVVDQKFEKPEIGLRYLRTSRILLCHDYCTDIQSQIYVDSIRMELLQEINMIRKRAYLLPRDSMVHMVSLSTYGEHSYANYNEEKYRVQDEPGMPIIEDWEFYDSKKSQINDFWKLPNFYECCTLPTDLEEFQKQNLSRKLYQYNLEVSQKQSKFNSQPYLFDENQKSLIKSQVPSINKFDLPTAESEIQTRSRFVDYQQAPKVHDQIVFQYLFYFRNFQNLFDLEYFKNKLSTNVSNATTLEQSVIAGVQFWESNTDININNQSIDDDSDFEVQLIASKTSQNQIKQKQYSLQQDEIEYRNKLAQQVILKMAQEKKQMIVLLTELDSIKDKFNIWQDKMMKLQLQKDLFASGKFLQDLVQLNFLNIQLALYSVREVQAQNGEAQKEIQTINELLTLFSHTDDFKVTYNNGYHVNLATTCTSRISLQNNEHRHDYNSFFLATLPIMDEQYLNPTEFNLIRGLYTTQSIQLKSYRKLQPYIGWIPQREFSYLDMKLLNISKKLRKTIAANVNEFDDQSLQYAHAKFRMEPKHYQYSLNTQIEILNEQKGFTKHQIKSIRLKVALIVLMTKRMLPNDAKKLQELYREFNERYSWRVSSKIDEITKHRKQLAQRFDQLDQMTGVQDIQKEMNNIKKKKELMNQTLYQYDFVSCEIDIYQREIQNFMILTAKRLIERETRSLVNAFEINGKRLEILIDVGQQFAATFDDKKKLNHLDIINKVAPVQKMLSQIKNRMLVIKTLTGGEGVVIRSKDLNLIMDELCRNIVRSGEIEMRTRCHQLCEQIIAYQDLLYAKDQQIYNLEMKLQHAKVELDKVVTTKVFAKGNSMIYELDHTQRQLRLIKDNLFQMEKKLKEKIRLNFDKDLENARLELAECKKKFAEYQTTLNSHVKADIQRNINEINVDLQNLVRKHKDLSNNNEIKSKEQLIDEYSGFIKGQTKQDFKDAKVVGFENFNNSVINSKDLEDLLREMERLKDSEKQSRQELLEMQNLIRKQRMLQNFKWLIAHRKWDQKIDDLKNQLSQNSTLWEQLAESEKRENVFKKELQRSQEQIATQDKVLDRLKDELRTEKIERTKLMNFKDSNIKRLNQLESMEKQMEIIANIDLNQVMNKVGSQERQLEQLQTGSKEGGEAIVQIYKNQSKELQRVRDKAKKESMFKEQALQKMDLLRAELSLLQSGDISSMNLWKDKVSKLREQKIDILSKFQTVDYSYAPQIQVSQSRQQLSTSTVTTSHLANKSQLPSSIPTTIKANQRKSSLVNLHSHINVYGASEGMTPNQVNRKVISGMNVLPELRGSIHLQHSNKKKSNIFDQLVQDNQSLFSADNGSHFRQQIQTRSNSVMQNNEMNTVPSYQRIVIGEGLGPRKYSSILPTANKLINQDMKEISSDGNIFSNLVKPNQKQISLRSPATQSALASYPQLNSQSQL